MTTLVQLYVYDLSNGLARQLSRQLTGRQIDGVWHTSIVAFGREVFYGQGIAVTAPGQSHHGRPLQVLDMGETSIDEQTFEEYLTEMREHYTADKYHLLEFNCNSFTNDCVGFLTGGSIPAWISDLPSDFLSTPFGAALRPTIDAMFRRPSPGAPPAQPPPAAVAPAAASPSTNPDLAASLLQAVASQAFANASQISAPSASASTATQTLASPVHICTNPSSFHNVLKTHRAVVAFFTSKTCPPCRAIEPEFERLAHERTGGGAAGGGGSGVAFVKVDVGAGMGTMVGNEWSVRVTPTFLFFRDGKKTSELKGANQAELSSQVDLLLWEAFPPHPHTRKPISSLEKMSTDPILFTQVPNLDAALAKLLSFIDASSAFSSALAIKEILSSEVVMYLTTQFYSPGAAATNGTKPPASLATTQLLIHWAELTKSLASLLPPAQLFPLVDMWRLALLDGTVSSWCATAAAGAGPNDPIKVLLNKALVALTPAQTSSAKNYLLTMLRLLSNAFANDALARTLVSPTAAGRRAAVTAVLVASLLHDDVGVRTAAATLAFNVAAFVQKGRLEQMRTRLPASASAEEEGEWEVEVVSAVVEAIGNERASEDVVHRLTASLGFMLRFSAVYESQHAGLLEVLGAREVLRGKLVNGGCGKAGVQRKEVRVLVQEVADVLC